MQTRLLPTPIPDLQLVETQIFRDQRGYFLEAWHQSDFSAAGLVEDFVQDNLSWSQANVLRGLHYQDARSPMGKLVRCLVGEIFDVALDLRPDSPSFGQWYGVYLSAQVPQRQLWVPAGFGHGFYVTAGPALVNYKCSGFYAPEHEGGIRWSDPQLGIAWPLLDPGAEPLVSAKDQAAPSFAEYCSRELEAGV
jgi:dTDP-4-dehydrorhamnose 3,5-epimerase